MKKRSITLAIIIAAVLVGCYILYSVLSQKYKDNKDNQSGPLQSILSQGSSSEVSKGSVESGLPEGLSQPLESVPEISDEDPYEEPPSRPSTGTSSADNAVASPEGTSSEPVSPSSAPASASNFKPATDFTVYDTAGNAVSLSSFKGQPVVVNFWASWCGPCKEEFPYFENAYKTYGSDVVFLMVNMTGNDTEKNAKKLISDNGYTFPIYFDRDNSASYNYSVYSIPDTAFVNKNGELVAYITGGITQSELTANIENIL